MYHDTNLPSKFQTTLERELQPGESVTWHAQPIPRWFAHKTPGAFLGGILMSCLMIPLTAMFAPGLILALPQLADPKILFFFLFVGSFMLLFWSAILVLFTAPLRLHLRDSRTLYLLTNRRALIVTLNWPKPKIVSFPASSLSEIYRYQHPDGSGDLILQRALDRDSDDNPHELGFDSIHNVHHAETLTRKLASPTPFPPLNFPPTSPLPPSDSSQPINPDLQSLFAAEVLPDETILLNAVPQSRDRALHLIFLVPLGFLTIGLGIAGLIFLKDIPPDVCPLWIIRILQIFDTLLFGIFAFSFFFHPTSAYKNATNSLYAITNRRVITMEVTERGLRIWSFAPHQIHPDPRIYDPGAIFGPPSVILTDRTWTNPQNGETAFETLYLSNLQNFKEVKQLLSTLASTDKA